MVRPQAPSCRCQPLPRSCGTPKTRVPAWSARPAMRSTVRRHVCAAGGQHSCPSCPVLSSHLHQVHAGTETDRAPRQPLRWLNPSKVLWRGKPAAQPPPEPPKWGLLDWQRYNQPFEVPWGRKELAVGMISWGVTFIAVGLVLVPVIGLLLGIRDFAALKPGEKSFFALYNQILETLVGLGVINFVVRGPRAEAGERSDELFQVNPSGPFKKPNGWLTWGLLGIVLAPAFVGLTAALVSAAHYDEVVSGGKGTVDGVAKIISIDTSTFLSLFTVTAVLAPVLEETVFRGFLLTSLSKYMPTWGAVLISSAGFAAAHASSRDLPQLFALGTLLGFSYVRSRSLLTPMLIHGAWNGTVLSVLYALTTQGVDISVLTERAQ